MSALDFGPLVLGGNTFGWTSDRQESFANIEAALDDSLKRLNTDYVDLYYAHRDDQNVFQLDDVTSVDGLVKAGKVREVGASNFSYERLDSARAIAGQAGLTPFTVAQDKYSLLERGLEAVLPKLAGLGVTELPYQVLASGFLTGSSCSNWPDPQSFEDVPSRGRTPSAKL